MAAALRDGTSFLRVILGAPEDWREAAAAAGPSGVLSDAQLKRMSRSTTKSAAGAQLDALWEGFR